jgi:hypothetical protein
MELNGKLKMKQPSYIVRQPDGFRDADSQRSIRKWREVITLFYEERFSELKQICRHGGRGRIFSALVLDLLEMRRVRYRQEPIFNDVELDEWYVHFAEENDIKLRTHEFYNPDIVFDDGTWVEITLSENTAYKKLFRYGHQAGKLMVLWLDPDRGRHKDICSSVRFPNAEVRCVESMLPHEATFESRKLISRLRFLKELKGILP